MTVHKYYQLTCNNSHTFEISSSQTGIPKCPECSQEMQLGWKSTVIRKSNITGYKFIHKVLIPYLEKKDLWYDIGIIQEYDRFEDDGNIIIANWNHVPVGLIELTEKRTNYELQYDDEYVRCSECGNFIRTSPTHYGWQCNYIMTEYEILCRDCVDINIIEDEFIGRTDKAIPSWAIKIIEDEGADFVCLSDMEESCQIFENGWYEGQNDDPKEVVKSLAKEFGLKDLSDKFDYIFAINSVGQFDIHFSLFLREK